MTARGNDDVLPMRLALNQFRMMDTEHAGKQAILTALVLVLVAADGLVGEYLHMIGELEGVEDDLAAVEVELRTARDALDLHEQAYYYEIGLAEAVRDEHDLCHCDPWIACRHSACRAASRLEVSW